MSALVSLIQKLRLGPVQAGPCSILATTLLKCCNEAIMKPLVSLIFLFLLGISAFGQSKISNSTDWWRTPQARQAHALKLHRDFEVLYNRIPTLSPSEEQWLKTEYDDTIAASGGRYTKRAVDAMATREWSIRIAKPHAFQIEYQLAMLSRPLDPAQEARHWTRLAALLMDHEFWQDIDDLQQRGVIDKQQLEFLGGFPGPTATLWAQHILVEVVLPYLDSK